jgi:hypothetical protein
MQRASGFNADTLGYISDRPRLRLSAIILVRTPFVELISDEGCDERFVTDEVRQGPTGVEHAGERSCERELRRITATVLHLRRTHRGKPLTLVALIAASIAALLLVVVIVERSANGLQRTANHAKPVAGTFAHAVAVGDIYVVRPTSQRIFRSGTTEGKVAVNEDRSTLIFTVLRRVTKLLVKPATRLNVDSRCLSSKPRTWCSRKTISSSRSPR